MAEWYAAAKKEGEVTWYTSWNNNDMSGVAAAFEKAYPGVKVNGLRATDINLASRIATEGKAHKVNADVIISDAPTVSQLMSAGELMPFDPPGQAKLPGGLSLPAGYTGDAVLNTSVITYNPTELKAAGLAVPTSWADFAKPEWKGKFSVITTAVPFYRSLIAIMGHDAALKLLTELGNNHPVLVTSHTLALTQVQSGEQIAAAVGYGYLAAELHAKTPDRLAFVNPDPLPTMSGLVDLVDGAPHPNAGKLFESWVLSQSGQTAVVSVTNKSSLLSDVGNDPTVYDPAKWRPAFVPPIISAADYNALQAEMNKAYHVPS